MPTCAKNVAFSSAPLFIVGALGAEPLDRYSVVCSKICVQLYVFKMNLCGEEPLEVASVRVLAEGFVHLKATFFARAWKANAALLVAAVGAAIVAQTLVNVYCDVLLILHDRVAFF